ncbi:hypothetical protein AYO21_09298 [Fonsecaea monophora]|uniref:Uncharacterized protein n=1 Tax=Fonsecaea monophora TaxID=254056 RepID=A0A177EYN7_9EURO|nr:hypothetical protein AYO21_09298 [Fonsecaea monophora]OAG36491.1 hypothetical protein AYO21_09298 [Fonsecaea monophora]
MTGFGAFPLANKIIVVTGGGSGINLAFVRQALDLEARVVVADLRLTAEAQDLVDTSPNAVFKKCDVADWKDLQNLVGTAVQEFGDVPDVYVAGAGVFEPLWSSFQGDTETERYSQVDINVNHPIKLTRIAIRELGNKKKKGVVLITGSIAGLRGEYAVALYCATKHAITGFVRSMKNAQSINGVKVVAVAPGKVHTPMWTEDDDKLKQFNYDAGRANTPDEVAAAMVDLIVEERYTGGTILQMTKSGTRVVEDNWVQT